ncbi:Uncharacterised protein [Serratia plymuthica]|uniref:Uncharacterized protein n=1 Tax=Serratia plymuthica TaxID=82996 RepID=A0A2X4UV72_SERPL|nr:Uncharacterised protein [Serratia plymuthica]
MLQSRFDTATDTGAFPQAITETPPPGGQFINTQLAVTQALFIGDNPQLFQRGSSVGKQPMQIGRSGEINVFGMYNAHLAAIQMQ